MKSLETIRSSLPPDSVKPGQVWISTRMQKVMIWDGETWLSESDLLYSIDFYNWLQVCMKRAHGDLATHANDLR